MPLLLALPVLLPVIVAASPVPAFGISEPRRDELRRDELRGVMLRDEMAAGSDSDQADGQDTQWQLAQMTIEQHIIIRIPTDRPGPPPRGGRFRRGDPPPFPRMPLAEQKGPRCIPIRLIDRASVPPSGGVDLMMRDQTLLRLKLSKSCVAPDLFSGFYIERTDDGALCAHRDQILARSGMQCKIDGIRRLVPQEQ